MTSHCLGLIGQREQKREKMKGSELQTHHHEMQNFYTWWTIQLWSEYWTPEYHIYLNIIEHPYFCQITGPVFIRHLLFIFRWKLYPFECQTIYQPDCFYPLAYPTSTVFAWLLFNIFFSFCNTVTIWIPNTWIPNTWIPDSMGVWYSNGKVMWPDIL